MKKIKRFFLTMSGMATLLFFKAGTVFGSDSVALYGVPSPRINEVPELYGVPSPIINEAPSVQPGVVNSFGTIFEKIALFVLLPLCIIAIVTVGIVALVKVNKKKKQGQNIDQNINQNNQQNNNIQK
jgi:hypothetical protein